MTNQKIPPPITSQETDSASDARNGRDRDQHLVRGVAWTVGVKWASLVIAWTATLIVARVLSPNDYGLMAMGILFISLVQMLSDLGLGTAVVKYKALRANQIAQINGLCVCLGLTGWLLTSLAAYPLSQFFQTDALFAVLIALGSNFLVTAFRIVPLSLLQRDMQFRAVAINDGTQAVLASITTVTLALLGFQYWALVLGNMLSSLVTTLLAYRLRPTPLAWPRRQDIGKAVTLGSHLIALRTAHYVCTSADQVIVGRVLGQSALGSYSFAMTIAAMPMDKLSGMVMRVLPSAISAVQDNAAALRRYVLAFTEGLAVVTMPAAVGLALVADDLVRFALGEAWLKAIVPFQILSISIIYRSITPIIPTVAVMIGLSRESMIVSAVAAVVLPCAFLVGSQWGTGGVAAVWLVVYPVVVVPYYYMVLRRINMRANEYLWALWPAASSAALMAIVVYVLHHYLYPDWHVAFRLTFDILAGALSYIAFLFAFHQKRISVLKASIGMLRSK